MTEAGPAEPIQAGSLRVDIGDESDVVVARNRGRELALRQGCSESAAQALAIAITEVARNALVHGGGGAVLLGEADTGGRCGVQVQVSDDGPGIADLALALQDGYSSTGTLGLGLSGAQRLVDQFEIRSAPGRGTTVVMRKWCVPPH